MGQDKAFLPFRGGFLAAHVAAAVAAAAGSVTLIGDPATYASLGYPVIPDLRPGAGPLGGIETALAENRADWNLILACDMPGVSPDFLRTLLDAAERTSAEALLPIGPAGLPEPLSAVYHRRCRGPITRALDSGRRKITEALAALHVEHYRIPEAVYFRNLNTPEEWARFHDSH